MHEPAAPTSRATDSRLAGLDVIRATAMLLGVGYHASIAFIPGISRWYPAAAHTDSDALRVFSDTLHAFRMELFFMLAGFFAHLLVEKRGPEGFIVDRCKRLGVPLLIMSPVIVALDWAERVFLQRHAALDPAYQPADTLLLRPLYLWFLEYLLIFSGFTWVLTRGRREHQGSAARPLHVPEVLLIMALPTWIIRHWLGEPTPAFSFVPQAAALLHFGLFFTAGFMLFALKPTEAGASRARWLAIPGLLGLIWFFTQSDRWSESMLALQAGLTWLAVLGCFTWGLSQRTPGHQRWRTLVDSAYWVYLAHFPLVMGAHVLCRDLEMPALLMFTVQTLLILIVTGVSFTSWVRTSPLAPWLGVKGRSS